MDSPMVDRHLNDRALNEFIRMPVSNYMISFLSQKAAEVIICETSGSAKTSRLPPSPPHTPPDSKTGSPSRSDSPSGFKSDPSGSKADLPSLEKFIASLCKRSHVQVATLMTTLVYLDRLKSKLPPVAKGLRCTVHRIFLAALILSAKFLNDSSPKNKHWADYSSVRGYEPFGFSRTEVNLMEKQLLYLLDWDLNITEDDLYTHLDPFLAPIRDDILRTEAQKRISEFRKQHRLQEQEERRSQDPYTPDMSSSYGSDRMRYDSTPGLDNIPELARSDTATSSGMSSSASSYRSHSRPSTPMSSVGSYYAGAGDGDSMMGDIYESYSTAASPGIVREPLKVEMSGANPGAIGGKGKGDLLPYEIPSTVTSGKKGKGNFWKFLGGGSKIDKNAKDNLLYAAEAA